MQGGCFTITNLGSFGIEGFTPIINHPETAILGVGAILREPVALEDGTFTSRLQMTLSLTFDHRILDGAPAARFLQTLRRRLEEPVAWLI
jgi:pyruvate dehydrogenase E2 component (dihydrolipoamide acetyltransferase)